MEEERYECEDHSYRLIFVTTEYNTQYVVVHIQL